VKTEADADRYFAALGAADKCRCRWPRRSFTALRHGCRPLRRVVDGHRNAVTALYRPTQGIHVQENCLVIVVIIAGILIFAATKPDTFAVQRSISIKRRRKKSSVDQRF
jgi:hypothetical protein